MPVREALSGTYYKEVDMPANKIQEYKASNRLGQRIVIKAAGPEEALRLARYIGAWLVKGGVRDA